MEKKKYLTFKQNIKDENEKKVIEFLHIDYDGTIANTEPVYHAISTMLIKDFISDKDFKCFLNNNKDELDNAVKKYNFNVWNSQCAGDPWEMIHMQSLSEGYYDKRNTINNKLNIFNAAFNLLHKIKDKNDVTIQDAFEENSTYVNSMIEEIKNNIKSSENSSKIIDSVKDSIENFKTSRLYQDNLAKTGKSFFDDIIATKLSSIENIYWYKLASNFDNMTDEQFEKKFKESKINEESGLSLTTNCMADGIKDKNFIDKANKKFDNLPMFKMIKGFGEFFANVDKNSAVIITSSPSTDVPFKLLANIKYLTKLKKYYENKEKSSNKKGKFFKKAEECSKAIEIMMGMLPEKFLKKDGKILQLISEKEFEKVIIGELKESNYSSYNKKVGYYKSNRISYQDVEEVLAIYLCGKWKDFDKIKDFNIDEYKKNKNLFDEEKYKNAMAVIKQLKEQYKKYAKPNPTMHILNILIRLKNIKEKNPDFTLTDKFASFVIEDSGSIDARSDIDKFFIGGHPRTESLILHNSDLNRNLFKCFGFEKEFDILAENIKNRNFGLYIPTCSNTSVEAMMKKSETPNNTVNTVNVRNVIKKIENAVYEGKINPEKLSHTKFEKDSDKEKIFSKEEYKVDNLSEQNKYLNDDDFSIKVLIKKIISDNKIRSDSEIKKSVNFILNSNMELKTLDSFFKEEKKNIKSLAKKVFSGKDNKYACKNFINDYYNIFKSKETKVKHIKKLAKMGDKKLSRELSAEECLNSIVECIKECKNLEKTNDYENKFNELKNKIKDNIVKYKSI